VAEAMKKTPHDSTVKLNLKSLLQKKRFSEAEFIAKIITYRTCKCGNEFTCKMFMKQGILTRETENADALGQKIQNDHCLGAGFLLQKTTKSKRFASEALQIDPKITKQQVFGKYCTRRGDAKNIVDSLSEEVVGF
jgi:hypothetical protein